MAWFSHSSSPRYALSTALQGLPVSFDVVDDGNTAVGMGLDLHRSPTPTPTHPINFAQHNTTIGTVWIQTNSTATL